MRVDRVFLRSAGVILALTGLFKVIAGAQELPLLAQPDPLFTSLSNRQLLIFVGGVELFLTAIVFLGQQRELVKLGLLAWFMTAAGTYRALLLYHGITAPCRCLGNLGAWLHLSPEAIQTISLVLFFYLLVGSYSLLIKEWFRPDPLPRRAKPIG
jgi:hypothetical protein